MGILYFILAGILGGAIVVRFYESYYERKEAKVGRLLAPKLEKLIELSSMKISKKEKLLERELTEDEKNQLLDEAYNEI